MEKHAAPIIEPLNEALEKHYKERIGLLEESIAKKDAAISEARLMLDRAEIVLKEKDAYIEELRTALVE